MEAVQTSAKQMTEYMRLGVFHHTKRVVQYTEGCRHVALDMKCIFLADNSLTAPVLPMMLNLYPHRFM